MSGASHFASTGSPSGDKKAETRKEASARRKQAHEVMRNLAPAALMARFPTDLLAEISGKVVSGFLPIGSEIDPRPLLESLGQAGAIITMPCVEAQSKPLVFREWRAGDVLVTEDFGTRAPSSDKSTHEPDILLVPMLAFDRKGYRLGYGGGFYDRTLERLRAMKEVSAVGIAYSGQEMDAVPRDELDQPLDVILTEKEVIRLCA